jgi:hypothetical protein
MARIFEIKVILDLILDYLHEDEIIAPLAALSSIESCQILQSRIIDKAIRKNNLELISIFGQCYIRAYSLLNLLAGEDKHYGAYKYMYIVISCQEFLNIWAFYLLYYIKCMKQLNCDNIDLLFIQISNIRNDGKLDPEIHKMYARDAFQIPEKINFRDYDTNKNYMDMIDRSVKNYITKKIMNMYCKYKIPFLPFGVYIYDDVIYGDMEEPIECEISHDFMILYAYIRFNNGRITKYHINSSLISSIGLIPIYNNYNNYKDYIINNGHIIELRYST